MATGCVMVSGERPALFETEQYGLQAICLAARGSPILAVVFSQVRVPSGHFGLSRLFGKTSHAALLINQPANDWYRGAEAAIDTALNRAIALTCPARIIFYGSSMGAYGALATAARWPDAEAVVFGPDFRIGEPASRSAAAGLGIAQGEPDLAQLAGSPRQGRLDIVFGFQDAYDAGVAARLRQRQPGDRVQIVPLQSSHEVHDHLYMLNVVRRVMSTFTREITAESRMKGLMIDQPDWAVAARLGDEAARPPSERDTAFLSECARQPHAGAAFLLSECHEARGHLVEAEQVLADIDDAIMASPLLSGLPMRFRKLIPIRRLQLLERLGRDGSDIRAVAAERFPGDEQFRAGRPDL